MNYHLLKFFFAEKRQESSINVKFLINVESSTRVLLIYYAYIFDRSR